MAYDPNKHDRRSMRLRGYDYAAAGAYFITTCTQGRVHLFGTVADGAVHENACGKIARAEWMRTGAVRENVALDAFVVMPNHVHGIIVITHDEHGGNAARGGDAAPGRRGTPGTCLASALSTTPESSPVQEGSFLFSGWEAPPLDRGGVAQRRRGRSGTLNTYTPVVCPYGGNKRTFGGAKPGTLSTIMRQYKSIVTKRIRRTIRPDFGWQRGFYDRIIRTRRALRNVRRYIAANPARWADDRLNG